MKPDITQGVIPILIGVDDDGTVWFRLYPEDANKLREFLVPGASIALHGVVSTYESSGGYKNPLYDDNRKDYEAEFVEMQDRFQLNVGSLKLVTITEGES